MNNSNTHPPLKIIFAGTPAFSSIALQAVLASPHRVCAVYTQPDRPAGRGRKLSASPVKQLALAEGIPVLQPPSLRDVQAQQGLRAHAADLMVVVAYGLMLPAVVLAIPPLGCINVHASLLPRWRGAAPIQRAIMAGDRESGISIMQMDAGLDTGALIMRQACPILDSDTAQTLHDRLALLGAQALVTSLGLLQQGGLPYTPQDEGLACYASKIEKSEAQLDWRQDAAVLERKVRALNPWPVAQTLLAPGYALRIWAAQALTVGHNHVAGKVISASKHGVDVATGRGILRLTQLQLPGGRVLAAADFINAHQLDGRILGQGEPNDAGTASV